ncbi:hypothetical protein CEXT_750611 [Caerostris extrusa]|uniref:Uncharacterized protein n=1 Tax=Caerostris extrusa TaxID=172846 RepID=A0AAV4TLT4_CAEEX|nr:hypothetical protein CEXT_750611 [Caerostris extrusa]
MTPLTASTQLCKITSVFERTPQLVLSGWFFFPTLRGKSFYLPHPPGRILGDVTRHREFPFQFRAPLGNIHFLLNNFKKQHLNTAFKEIKDNFTIHHDQKNQLASSIEDQSDRRYDFNYRLLLPHANDGMYRGNEDTIRNQKYQWVTKRAQVSREIWYKVTCFFFSVTFCFGTEK